MKALFFYPVLMVLLFSIDNNSAQTLSPGMVSVDGGTFTTETTPVTISSFKIDTYEVTYKLWTDVRNWGLKHGYSDLPAGQNGCDPVGSNNPVTGVNWWDVVKWCNARSEKYGLTPVYYTDNSQSTVYRTGEIDINIDAVKWTANGYRLPTDCEWEFAARGGNQSHGYVYSGSNSLDEVGWDPDNSSGSTHEVGQKKANELGIYDMSGNVGEWCWDWYNGQYPSEGTTDPKGPLTTQSARVRRGGCSIGEMMSGLYRVDGRSDYTAPNNRVPSIGFRCVQGK